MSVNLNNAARQEREDVTRRIEKFVADLGAANSCNEYDNTLTEIEKEIAHARLKNQRVRSVGIVRSWN